MDFSMSMTSAPTLDDRVRRVLATARDEAVQLLHDHVGTGHVLLAIMDEPDGGGRTVLRGLGIEPTALRQRVAELVSKCDTPGGRQEIPYTRAAKNALEFAFAEASRRGYTTVGSELLLIGLVQDDKATAAQALATFGVNADMIVARISDSLG